MASSALREEYHLWAAVRLWMQQAPQRWELASELGFIPIPTCWIGDVCMEIRAKRLVNGEDLIQMLVQDAHDHRSCTYEDLYRWEKSCLPWGGWNPPSPPEDWTYMSYEGLTGDAMKERLERAFEVLEAAYRKWHSNNVLQTA
ncbi:hypothetical protein VTK73DRAFT_3732 [Phialemonium thermophilum]|uniref:Uncharacterized protein n=1 Tax=Phialemonium thermophilum TaxID=223376 RepID=A0ABR3VFP7_9PEZI